MRRRVVETVLSDGTVDIPHDFSRVPMFALAGVLPSLASRTAKSPLSFKKVGQFNMVTDYHLPDDMPGIERENFRFLWERAVDLRNLDGNLFYPDRLINAL